MKTRYLLGLVMITGTAACADDDENPTTRTVVDVAREAGEFDTLVGALEATGLDEALSGDGPFTVFAPTDAAFARLPAGVVASLDEATLSGILTYHVTPGRVPAETVVSLDEAATLHGGDVSIRVVDGGVVLDGTVQVITTDIEADNGIIHVIDAVLLPPEIEFPGTIVDAAAAYPRFDALVGAVTSADLAGALSGDNDGDGFTVFAPDNAAFEALGVDVATIPQDDLANILLYHVVSGTVGSAQVVGLTEAMTLQGSPIDIGVESGVVTLDGDTEVTWTDIETSNGVIHVIDKVLIPAE